MTKTVLSSRTWCKSLRGTRSYVYLPTAHRLKKIFNMGGGPQLRAKRVEQALCGRRSGGPGGWPPGGGWKGAASPCLRKCCILRAKYASFQVLFYLNLQKYMISGGRKGGSLCFPKRICIFGNHKCTILVPFLSIYIRIDNLGVARGWWAKYA